MALGTLGWGADSQCYRSALGKAHAGPETEARAGPELEVGLASESSARLPGVQGSSSTAVRL